METHHQVVMGNVTLFDSIENAGKTKNHYDQLKQGWCNFGFTDGCLAFLELIPVAKLLSRIIGSKNR